MKYEEAIHLDCSRFEQAVLARSRGELTDEEQRLLASHPDECEACERIAVAEGFLRSALVEGASTTRNELAHRRWLDGLVEAADQAPSLDELLPAASGPRTGLRVAMGVAVAAGLAIAFWIGSSGVVTGATGLDGAPQVPTAATGPQMLTAVGVVSRDGRPVSDGEVLRNGQVLETGAGRAVISVPGSAKLVLEAESRIRATSLAGREIRIELERGQVLAEVSPLAQGQLFAVVTRFGRIEVVGTVFSVKLEPESAAVSVERGQVRVIEPGKPTRTIKAGETTVLGASATAVTGMQLTAGEQASQRVAAKSPSEGQRSDVSVETDAQAPVIRPSLGERMAEARQLRAARQWLAAASAYEAVIADQPSSQEAAAALVALGEIRLKDLSQPEQALRSFEAYLERHPQGPLATEAAFGRLGALRELGRLTAEKAALREFLVRFPRSIQASLVSKRLTELER